MSRSDQRGPRGGVVGAEGEKAGARVTTGEKRAAEVALGGEEKHTACVETWAREATYRQTLASGKM